MQQRPSENDNENIYEHTYCARLPASSVDILSPIVEGLTCGSQPVNRDYRELLTLGVWLNDTHSVTRCCMVQPEVASATCTIPLPHRKSILASKEAVSERHPGAPECGMSVTSSVVQMSGRMTPYVVEDSGLRDKCKWGFVNACKSKVLFVHTDTQGPQVLTLTRQATAMLKPYMSDDTACVYDDAMSCYKITVAPDPGDEGSEANKNTCLILYGDGTIRVQGTPSKALRPCASFRRALVSISETRMWYRFLKQLVVLDTSDPETKSEPDLSELSLRTEA